MSYSAHRKIPSNITLIARRALLVKLVSAAGKNHVGRAFSRNTFPPSHRRSRWDIYSSRSKSSSSSSSSNSSSSSSGNKACFIFTIPPAKYRPVFPRDIDISGVPGLLLLTPFLHWLGIYVFFLLFSFRPLLFSPSTLLFSASLSRSHPAFSSVFLILFLVDGDGSSSRTHPPILDHSSRFSDNQSRTRIYPRLQNQPEISIRNRITAASFLSVLDRTCRLFDRRIT